MHARLIVGLMVAALGTDDARATRPVAAKLQPFIERHHIAGAVTLIGDKEDVVSVEMIGAADLGGRRPMKPDTLFWIASMTKSVTSTAVMMLVSDGKLKLDDPIEKFLPEFTYQALVEGSSRTRSNAQVRPARSVTVRDLLTHTSGIIPHPAAEDHLDRLSLAENVVAYARAPLRFQPGSRYEYSNAGFHVAGRIVEIVSGMSFEQFLQEKLFGPLGMTDTTFWPNAEQLKRLAKSYRPNRNQTGLQLVPIDQLTYPLDDRHRAVSPAGGLFSTAPDLYRLGRMILNGGTYGARRYLSRAAIAQMTSNQIGNLPMGTDMTYAYGLGWIVHRLHPAGDPTGPGTFGAGGAYNTQMGIDPAHDLVSIMLVQQAGSPESERQKLRTTFTQAAEDARGR